MYSIDNSFLEQVGLSSMPEEQKGPFLEYAQEQLEVRIGEQMSAVLSEAQLDEFEKIINNDPEVISTWATRLGDYKRDTVFTTILENLSGDPDDPEVLTSYITAKWLDQNCPQYTQIIENSLSGLKEEVSSQRNSFLAA